MNIGQHLTIFHDIRKMFLALLLAMGLALLPAKVFAATGTNEQISFQGKVTNADGTNVTNNSYSFTFKLYTISSGGAAIWTETKTLTVTDGVFQTNLGSVTALPGSVDFNTDNLYLGIEFNSDGEMSPRVQFTAVPQAFNALKVAGLTVTDTTGTLTIQDGKTVAFADAFSTSGAFPLILTVGASTNVTLPATGTLSTLAGSETLTNKTLTSPTVDGSTGLTFSGSSTDITTAAGEALVIQGNAASIVQTTSGSLTFQAAGSSTTSVIQIGTGGAGSTTPDFLALDAKSSTGDPAGGAEGYMYYNTFDNKFRCYQNAAWTDCIGAGGGGANWDTIGDPSGNGAVAMAETAQNLDWNTAATATAVDGLTFTLTNDASADSVAQRLLVVSNEDSTGSSATERLLVLDNKDIDESVTTAIEITSAAGTIGTAVDVSDAEIGTALAIGSNDITTSATTLSSTELDRLDGKDAALVDQNDLTNADGAGGTSSGSGLEAGTGGIGLLQGCADNQVLVWNEASSIWECGSNRATYQARMSANYTNATTTFTNVTDLGFPVGANETWIFQMNAQYVSPAAADSKWLITAPSGSTCDFAFNDIEGAVTVANVACGTSSGTIATTGGQDSMFVSGTVATAATSGNVQLQFGQAAVSGTSTINLGSYVIAYKVTGADLAETYYTNDATVGPGSVVSIDPALTAGVKKSSGQYDKGMLGVISTTPGLVLGDNTSSGRPVFLALSGRVPVKVSTENGDIVPGDFLTSSSTPGVAMKATKTGSVIGQALTSYAGPLEGEVIVFLSKANQVTTNLDETFSLTDAQSADTFGRTALQSLLSQQAEQPVDMSDILVDRLVAGMEIVTPKITTDVIDVTGSIQLLDENGEERVSIDAVGDATFSGTLRADRIIANNIEGLEIITEKLEIIDKQLAQNATQSGQSEDGLVDATTSPSPQETPTTSPQPFPTAAALVGSSFDAFFQLVDSTIEFAKSVVFKGSVFFSGRMTFSNEVAGYATVKKGSKEIHVEFPIEYESDVVVTATPDKPVLFAVNTMTKKGFKIVLKDNAEEDTRFSWIVLSVKDVRSFDSGNVQSSELPSPPSAVQPVPSTPNPTPGETLPVVSPSPSTSPSPQPSASPSPSPSEPSESPIPSPTPEPTPSQSPESPTPTSSPETIL